MKGFYVVGWPSQICLLESTFWHRVDRGSEGMAAPEKDVAGVQGQETGKVCGREEERQDLGSIAVGGGNRRDTEDPRFLARLNEGAKRIQKAGLGWGL